MSADGLRRRVDDEVGAVGQGRLVERSGEGAVDEEMSGACFVLRPPDVGEGEGGIGRRLDPHDPRPRTQSGGDGALRWGVHEGGLDAVAREVLGQHPRGLGVDPTGGDHVIPRLDEGRERPGDGPHPTREGRSRLGAFERRHLRFEGRNGRVGPTGVDEARAARLEAGRRVGGVIESEGAGHDQGRIQRARRAIHLVSPVDREGERSR